jgi:hypothetical protein
VEKRLNMKKLAVMAEREEFQRVWNFIVPLRTIANNNPVQSILLLTKQNSSRKIRKTKRLARSNA